MEISTSSVKELRDESGSGVMECRNALVEAEGDMGKALHILKQRSLLRAEKKKERSVTQGIIKAYIHTGERIGAMVELSCETDFVARTDEFKQLAHNLAMQVAAIDPKYIAEDELPEGADLEPAAACLLLQSYIKEPDKTIQAIINDTIALVGENIKVKRFARFEVGV
ncbi:elongation factor Ts [Chloroflexota bacterium]